MLQSCKPDSGQQLPSWTGIQSIISKSDLPLKAVGFLPIMPAPVTNHSTVYSCLLNFIDLCEQMEQPSLAFVVDEGVYQYIMDISLAYPDSIKTIFPMLGGFHMEKSLPRCIRTYLEGSEM